MNTENSWRAVWAHDAGFHYGGHPPAWDEDIRNCHCTITLPVITLQMHVCCTNSTGYICSLPIHYTFLIERGYSDGDSHRNVLWLLAGSVILHLFSGLPMQCPDYHASDAVPAGESTCHLPYTTTTTTINSMRNAERCCISLFVPTVCRHRVMAFLGTVWCSLLPTMFTSTPCSISCGW